MDFDAYDIPDEYKDILERYLNGGESALTEEEVAAMKALIQGDESFRNLFRQVYSHRQASLYVPSAPTSTRRSTTSSRTSVPTTYKSAARTNRNGGANAYRNSQGRGFGGNSKIVSPGGFKKSGLDEDSAFRREGHVTDQTPGLNSAEIIYDENGSVVGARYFGANGKLDKNTGAMTAKDKTVRTMTKAEVQNVINRGLRGATLDIQSQSIYDAWRQEQEAKALERQQAKARAEEYRLGVENDIRSKNELAYKNQLAKNKLSFQTDESVRKQKLLQELKDAIEKRKLDQAEKLNDEFNARYGVDAGTHLTDKEKELIETGKKKWGYSPEEQKKLEDLERQLQEIYLGGNASEEDRAALESQKYDFENGLKKRLVENGDPLTAEQTFNGTYTMEDGTILGVDQNGKLYTVWEPKPDADEKRNQALQDRRDRWIDSRADKYLKEKVGGFDPDTKDNPKYGYDEALDLARKDAVTRFGVGDAESGSLADIGFENGSEEIDAPSKEIATAICPVCGAPLDENGYCAECGYQEGVAENGEEQNAGFEEEPVRTHMKSSYL